MSKTSLNSKQNTNNITNKRNLANIRKGEKKVLPNGFTAEIIAYRNNKDIDVRFSNGTTSYIGEHLAYSHFVKGDIAGTKVNKYKAQEMRKNEEAIMNCGLKAKITNYIDSKHVEVTLETGEIQTVRYGSFQRGEVCPAGYNPQSSKIAESKEYWVDREVIATNGQKMKCIDYDSANGLTVQFEDQTIVKNVRAGNFKRGRVGNPNLSATQARHNKHKGETNVNNQGCKMTLLEYRDWNDITVKFDDGTIIDSTYGQFKTGKLENPNNPRVRTIDRKGESKILFNGLAATIIAYRNNTDIDVQFEDQAIVHTNYTSFSNGHVAHPTLKASGRGYFKTFTTDYVGTNETGVYYACTCKVCGLKDIMTPHQMMEHAKQHE